MIKMDLKKICTHQLVLLVMTGLKELNKRKDIEETMALLEKDGMVLNVNPEGSCPRKDAFCNKFRLP